MLLLLLSLLLGLTDAAVLDIGDECVYINIGVHKFKLLPDTNSDNVIIYGMQNIEIVSSSNSFDSLRGMDMMHLDSRISIPVRIDFGYQETPFLNPGTCDGIFPLGKRSPLWSISETISVAGSSLVTGRGPPRGSVKISPGGLLISDYPDHLLQVEFSPHRTSIIIPSNMISLSGHLLVTYPLTMEIPLEFYMIQGILSMSRDQEQLNDDYEGQIRNPNETISLGLSVGQISVTSYSQNGDIYMMPLQCLHSGQTFYASILIILLLSSVFLYYWQSQLMEFSHNFVNLWFYSLPSFTSSASTTVTKKSDDGSSSIEPASLSTSSINMKRKDATMTVGHQATHFIKRHVFSSMNSHSTMSASSLLDDSDGDSPAPIPTYADAVVPPPSYSPPPQESTPQEAHISSTTAITSATMDFRIGFPRTWTSGRGIRCIMTRYEVLWTVSCQIFLYTFFLAFGISQPASCRFCQSTWACTTQTDSTAGAWQNSRIVIQNSIF